MKKVVLIPDSFKGNMESLEVCNIMESALKKHFPNIEIVKIPVADGGEGTVDSFLFAMGGNKKYLEVTGPNFDKINAFYGQINQNTAVIEMSAVAGLPITKCKNPSLTTTFGVGELILDAIKNGATKIVIGLGGSSTNDCGVGCFCALGAKFYNSTGEFVPTGATLSTITKIDITKLKQNTRGVQFVTMCDIDNPLYGKNGASYVFASQKGADTNMVKFLDSELVAFSKIVQRELGFLDTNFSGAGSAGGMGYGMKAFLGSTIQMGIDTVLDIVDFDKISSDADLILSGEGKFDNQSLSGKVVIGVAKHAKMLNVPLIAVVGDIGDNIDLCYDMGVTAVYSINRVAKDFSKVKARSKQDLYLTVDTIARTLML